MESTIKVERAIEFYNGAVKYLDKYPKERSSLTYALNKLVIFYRKKVDKGSDLHTDWQNEVNETIEDIRVKHCEKDGAGLLKEKTYGEGHSLVIQKVFMPDKEKIANKEIREAAKSIETKWNDKEIEFKKHIVSLPSTLDINWIELFNDFVLEPVSDEELEKHYLAQGEKKELPELIPN